MSIFARSYRAPDDLMQMAQQFDNIRAANADRVGRMEQYRRENNTVRDSRNDLQVFDLTDYGRRPKSDRAQPQKHSLPIPLGKATTVKHSYRISGAPFDMTVDTREDTVRERHRAEIMEKVAWSTYKHSRGQTTVASGAWDGSEIGTTVFDLYFDISKNQVCFRRIDPVGFYEVQGVDDPHDFECTYRVWKSPLATVMDQYRDKFVGGAEVVVDSIRGTHKDGDVDMVDIVQKNTKTGHVRWASGADENSTVLLKEYTHNYGFVPNVVIPNIGPYEDVWGFADYEFVRSLAAYIPALLGREADILRAVANGGMIERGTGQQPQTVKRVIQEGGILSSKREGTVDPIQTPDMPSFHADHLKQATDLFKMVGFTPDAAWGMPGSGSGSDRGLQLQPLLEYTGMKQMNWSAGMSRLYGYVFQMVEQKTTGTKSYSGVVPGKRDGQGSPYKFLFGPGAASAEGEETNDIGLPMPVDLPMTPKEVFDGEYGINVKWRNRIDPDDPQYVMSEMNKFTQGAQSLQTTLENLGVQAPEDEMRRIEKEAERFPWINQGMVALLKQQMSGNQQGQGGGGSEADMGAGVDDAMASMMSEGGGGGSGSLNADAAISAQGPGASGIPYGGA